jgi:hypothetical protein
MKPQELRIGNIVEVNHFEYGDMFASVTSINDVGDLCLHLLDERFTKEEYECMMNEVVPIPITDELLLKIGFKKKRDGYLHYSNHNDEFSIKFDLGYAFIEYANLCFNPEDVTETNYGSSLEFPNTLHLHTLQNIWHLLTGKELEIKL